MSANEILKMAQAAGVSFSLTGDKLSLKCAAKPPDRILDAIKADKDNIMALLKRDSGKVPVEVAAAEPPAPMVQLDPHTSVPASQANGREGRKTNLVAGCFG